MSTPSFLRKFELLAQLLLGTIRKRNQSPPDWMRASLESGGALEIDQQLEQPAAAGLGANAK
jgi:hypothetical protein